MLILVVEDSPTQSNALRIKLQRRGLEVECAATLAQAIEHVKTTSVEVILLDLSLPDSSGIATFYKMLEVSNRIPIVVYTGLDDQQLALEAVKNGAQDYLIKGLASDDSVLRCLRYAVERQKVQLELRRSEKRLRIILENSYDAFISLDWQWRITEWNIQAEKTFGISREQALGQSLATIVPHHLRKQYAREIETFFKKSKGTILRKTSEITAVHQDGREFPIEIALFRIKEDPEDTFCAFVRDITEIKQLNEELERRVQERTAELTTSNEELKQFAKVASHDLQEPLRAVQGFCDLLLESTANKLNSEDLEFIGYIVDGSQRMQQLIQAVLDHSGIHRNEGEEHVTDCNSVIEAVLANLSAAIKDSGTRLDVDNLPLVAVERSQLIQLFQNLISNAIKYHSSKSPRIYISAERTVNEWLFSVRDNGIGIDPKYSNKIFDMFARLHGKTQYSGTGMGLAICKKIVTSHGGKIWVESEPGEGSIFLFTLPAVNKGKDDANAKPD